MRARLEGSVQTITPNLASFATPYSSGDVLGGVLTLANAVEDQGSCSLLVSLAVLDKANQKSAIDLIFFSDLPTNSVGADNAAYALNDADLGLVLGRISIPAADYVSAGTNNAEATEKNINLLLQAKNGQKNIYMLAVARGTPTYGSASDLAFRIGLQKL